MYEWRKFCLNCGYSNLKEDNTCNECKELLECEVTKKYDIIKQ